MMLAQRSLSAKVASRPAQASRRTAVKAQARQSWCPGIELPAHLNGSLAGDFGFDPLLLGKDPEALRWYVQAELIHCRTAMTAVAGILLPGIADKLGFYDMPEWYEAGKVYLEKEGAIPFNTLLVIQFYLYGWAESKRWQDFKKPKSQAEAGTFLGLEYALAGKENGYPGGPFDFLGLSNGPLYADYKLKEVKNGRLAMLALLGFAAQYAATGKGPIDNLIDHVKDPWHTTFAENGVSLPFSI